MTPSRRQGPAGKGPLALRVGLSSGAGFDLTEQGTEKRLALWLVSDPALIEGVAGSGRPAQPRVRPGSRLLRSWPAHRGS